MLQHYISTYISTEWFEGAAGHYPAFSAIQLLRGGEGESAECHNAIRLSWCKNIIQRGYSAKSTLKKAIGPPRKIPTKSFIYFSQHSFYFCWGQCPNPHRSLLEPKSRRLLHFPKLWPITLSPVCQAQCAVNKRLTNNLLCQSILKDKQERTNHE